MKLFSVTNKEHSHGGRIGIFMCEDETSIKLNFGEEQITFRKSEVKEISFL